MNYTPDLSIVIPFYNEEVNIGPTASEVLAVMGAQESTTFELILVDDGSRDRTGERADALARRDTRVRALHLVPNSGQSAALAAGFRAARGTVIATLDGDGQNDPADIPKALDELKRRRADMVAGIRKRRRDGVIRKLSSRIAYLVRSGILRDGIVDTGCGLKVFQRAPMLHVCLFRNSHRFYPALFQMHGYRVVQLPVAHRERKRGTSKYGGGINSRLWVGLADLAGVLWLKHRAFNYRVEEARPPR
ncbi:MAG: dolichol-phosphate mannosyltransferase [Candidatus Sumerlaeota bacterium]|nr:dolichol-phosphate mannosyltransferase [Candidatus Sumerlaeota bacterium]